MVFISYRRIDTAYLAGRLQTYLVGSLGGSRVFFDKTSILGGEIADDVLDDALSTMRIMVALIGPRWHGPSVPGGMYRISETTDYVRRELLSAYKRKITILPCVVDGNNTLADIVIPEELKFIYGIQWLKVEYDADFDKFCSDVLKRIYHTVFLENNFSDLKVCVVKAMSGPELIHLQKISVDDAIRQLGEISRWDIDGRYVSYDAEEFSLLIEADLVIVIGDEYSRDIEIAFFQRSFMRKRPPVVIFSGEEPYLDIEKMGEIVTKIRLGSAAYPYGKVSEKLYKYIYTAFSSEFVRSRFIV